MLKLLMTSLPRLRLAAAESLTGGNVQALITAESGASNYFVGGVTAYTIDQKVGLLGVVRRKAEACNGVSHHVARHMAWGVCRLMKANIAIATTGYAEPDPEHGAPLPKAHWAICHLPKRGRAVFIDGYGEFPRMKRTKVQKRVTGEAIAALERYLATLDPKTA
jgi:nicotinamide-nucleotide amidase